jgi:TRAP transporter TAXI family solute receptor
MKNVAVVGLVVMLLAPIWAIGATRVSVGAGPWGGVYFSVGTALADILNKHIPGVNAVAEAVTGSAHGLELVHKGELTIALVGLSTAHFGVRGQREFDRKYDNVGFVMAAMDTGQTLVTVAESGIKTFADIKGLRVAVNTPTSKIELLAALKPYSVKETDFQLSFMNYAGQIAALREGTIDAAFIAVSPRNTDVVDLAAGQPIRILGFDAEKARAFEAQPYWAPIVIRARTYPGQDHDLLVPGTHTTLLAHKQADPALIYQIVKTIIEHGAELGALHPGGREFTIEKTRDVVEKRLVPMAFHPGAERYWRERGVLK